jgi:hypothetical protein
MSEEFYTTKLLIEVDVSTQFGPRDAICLVKTLLKCPAITSVSIKSGHTNYNGPHEPPATNMRPLVLEPPKG